MIWYFPGMRLSRENVSRLCRERRLTLEQMLRQAGVSRNAYYTLARRPTVLPHSATAVARVPPSAILSQDDTAEAEQMRELARTAAAIARRHPGADPENIRHTLILLREEPLERLRRALRRGRQIHVQ